MSAALLLILGLLVQQTSATAQDRGRVEVVATWADATPAAGVHVRMFPVAAGIRGPLRARWRRTGEHGRTLFEDLPGGTYLCDGDRGGRVRVEVGATATVVQFTIPGGVAIRGRVVDDQGSPVAGARLWLSTCANTENEGVVVAALETDGTFELRDVQPGRLLRAVAAEFAPSRATVIDAHGQPLLLRCDRAGRSVRGGVRDADGQPVRDALVTSLPRSPPTMPDWYPREAFDDRPAAEARTDDAGHFELLGLPAEPVRVWVGHDCHAPTSKRLEPGNADLDITLQRSVRLRGFVHAGDGVPVDGAEIVAGSHSLMAQAGEGTFHLAPEHMQRWVLQGPGLPQGPQLMRKAWLAEDWSAPEWAQWRTRTAADGSCALEGLPPGRAFVRASKDTRLASRQIELDRAASCDLVLGPAAELSGTLQGPRQEPLREWLVVAIPKLPGTSDWLVAMTDVDGGFRIVGCADVPYDLVVTQCSTRWLQLPREGLRIGLGVLPADCPVVLTAPIGNASCGVRISLRNPGGGDLYGAVLTFERTQPSGKELQIHFARPTEGGPLGGRARPGASVVGPLPEGKWTLTARWRDLVLPLGDVQLLENTTLELGTVEFVR